MTNPFASNFFKSIRITYSKKIPVRFIPNNYFLRYKIPPKYNMYQLMSLLMTDKIDLKLPTRAELGEYKHICGKSNIRNTSYIRLVQITNNFKQDVWHPLLKVDKEGVCDDCKSNIFQNESLDSIIVTYSSNKSLYLETSEGAIMAS